MRIIKRGSLPEEELYKATCSNCGTIFEFQKMETKYIHDQRDGDYRTINCPLCSDIEYIYD